MLPSGRKCQHRAETAEQVAAEVQTHRHVSQGKHELAGAVKALATGAIRTRQMKHEAQYATGPACKSCQAQFPETLQHWAYQCDGNDEVEALADHQEILL